MTMTTQYPIGHYAVREKSANNYYTNDGQIHYFNVVIRVALSFSMRQT